MDFGDELKRIRESRGMTVNQLAMYSDVSSATISRVENKKRGVPRPKYIKKLAEALKYPYIDLMRLAGYGDEEEESGSSIEETEEEQLRMIAINKLKGIKEIAELQRAVDHLEFLESKNKK